MENRIERKRFGLYRSRNGIIFGVCRGIADYLDISVFWTRVIVLAFLMFTGVWPIVGLYILAAFLMKPEPVLSIKTDEDYEFYNSYMASGNMALRRVKRTYENLNRRIQRLEDLVTKKEYDWEQRLNKKA